MVLLLCLNAALWDFRDSTELTGQFLKIFRHRMFQLQKDNNTCIDGAFHALIMPYNEVGLSESHLDRLWFVGKALKIAKRFTFASWIRVVDSLATNLIFQPQQEVATSLPNDLRSEMLNGDQTSWIASYLEPVLDFGASSAVSS